MDPGAVQKRLAQAAVKLYKARKELKRYKAAKKIVEEQEAEAAEKAETTEYIRRPTFSILETILEVSEVKTVDIEVHGMKAKFYLSRPDEDIVPLRYLKKADTDKIVHRAVWIFSKAKDGRQVNQDKWPTLETVFFDVFHNLKNSPQWDKALFDDDKGSTATCPPNTDFRLARFNQDNVLHALISELFFNVDVMHPTSKPMLWFHLHPKVMGETLEYWTGYKEKRHDGPCSSGRIVVEYYPDAMFARTVLPVATTLTDNQPLDKALCQNFQLHLGQLLTNLHHLHINKYCLPDQEVFLINLHGSRLHVQRAVFPSPKISRIYCKKYKPADPKSELHTFRAGDTTRRYTEQDLEYDIDQLDWLHTLREDNNEAPDEEDKPVIRVLASQEYDLWTRSGWHAALKLLAGLNRYLMGGRAKCGVMQNMFEKFPIAESPPKESSAAKS
ncbi:hypothetical protein CBS63078_3726 [Aspergillus niger]|nr:hypothetical protein ANI_1_1072124 [Aspergillus niger CBS 513.88]KAI2821084.1 hypothetical protein CBS115989_3151 [Aspergillus niger]KAI2828973.1 hypothetical protein CBS133816_4976 [Aspergillus niger]KAI2851339.1 hypothetical protein CBS11350_1243 [Aspergillus niger]KAI2858140.1 hypothetical protein CBS11232_2789 [Aspergillus niger]KAI2858817.1 hypothetical protein CBS12448_6016 [Aspergillus niger]|eukprot:XP_001400706.2 hypothetical protein ANI_1_1072124 [Aspergillus niger CBS 513.88]